jgi:hypothetical protein
LLNFHWACIVHIIILRPQPSKGPKALISIKDVNVTFQPEKIGHAHGLQITYQKDSHTRSIFVYHENGEVGISLCILLFIIEE